MVFLFGFVIGVFCFTGFNYAVWIAYSDCALRCRCIHYIHTYIEYTDGQLQHIAPLVYSSLLLLDPAVTAVLSWVLGVEPLPGTMVWTGGAVVLAGQGDHLHCLFANITQLLVCYSCLARRGVDFHRRPLAELGWDRVRLAYSQDEIVHDVRVLQIRLSAGGELDRKGGGNGSAGFPHRASERRRAGRGPDLMAGEYSLIDLFVLIAFPRVFSSPIQVLTFSVLTCELFP